MDLHRVKRSLYIDEKLRMQEGSGYTKDEALMEASRCLNCRHRPCVNGCVANLPVPDFIQAIKNDDLERAQQYIYSKSKLSRICCRVCFQEKQCEGACTLGIKGESIAIGLLERFVGDNQRLPFTKNTLNDQYNVGIIGSGPAGLACALELLQQGINVTIYERNSLNGGVLRYGIPKYRLDNQLVDEVVAAIETMGGKFENNVWIGKDLMIDTLLERHQYIFLGSGAGNAMKLNATNENQAGVFSAYAVLAALNEETHPQHQYFKNLFKDKIVKVVGGGNVAMDSARSIARLNPQKVSILYRRSENELPARKEEILEARIDGVEFELLLNPYEFVGDNEQLKSVKCRKMILGDIDESGRRSVSEDLSSSVELAADFVIIAIGGIGETFIKDLGININRKNLVEEVNDSHQTSNPQIYAGGDIISGPLTVVSAMKQGIEAGMAIGKKLLGK